MRMIFLGLSLLTILLSSQRFNRFETVGYDSGALFLLLAGIQLLVTAAIFYEHHESRTSKASPSDKDGSSMPASPDNQETRSDALK